MSMLPYDPDIHMEKHCFAPCPEGVFCECLARMGRDIERERQQEWEAFLARPVPKINWIQLGVAVEHYESLGYQHVDVPWAVPNKVARMTFPGKPLNCHLGALIGSAEQGFLAMEIEEGAKLVSCSPCFRTEPVHNVLYQPWFMKVELYREGHHVEAVLDDAMTIHDSDDTRVIETSEGFDILINDIEVGSYGVREVNGRKWTYGTGLALPRFNVALARYLG